MTEARASKAPDTAAATSSDTAAIRTSALSKRFGGVRAVDGVDLVVPRGSVYGLIGPNGAGKTTTFSLVCGWVRPSGGTIEVLGHAPNDITALKGRLSALPQDAVLPPGVPILSSLAYYARLQGFARPAARTEAERVLELVGLSKWGHIRALALSHGMAKRVGIAQAFMGHPELVLLDEPTAGLDPKSAHHIRSIIMSFKAESTTVVISSHNLFELESMCDHAAILDHGKVVTQGPMDELTASDTEVAIELADPEERFAAFTAAVEKLETVTTASMDTGRRQMIVRFKGAERPADVVTAILKTLIDGGAHIASVQRGQGLERRVLSLT